MSPAARPASAPFARGFRDGLPFLVALTPFGLLFGVAAVEAGLGIGKALAFSVAVIAGASQFTALSLMQEGAPLLVVLATALAVNLRMAMYSASLAPHLGGLPLWQRALAAYCLVDATYAASIRVYEEERGWSPRERAAYYAGVCLPICPAWFGQTLLGAMLGRAVPDWLALDFAVPVCFLAMVAPGLRTLAHLLAAGTSVALALALAWMPHSSGLLVAALAAMAVGAETERRMERRARA